MAKRANPFIEDFIPQSKVHVGIKQFNNNDERLKKVYEKTLELLFKGAKTVPLPVTTNNNDIHFMKKNEKMKQLFIGKNGTLQHSGSLLTSIASKQCSCGGPVECQCAYCEAALCGSCQRGCVRCERPHCTRCMLNGYEGSDVCMSCYG